MEDEKCQHNQIIKLQEHVNILYIKRIPSFLSFNYGENKNRFQSLYVSLLIYSCNLIKIYLPSFNYTLRKAF